MKHTRKLMPNGEPFVDQGMHYGWHLTYNPDTSKWHVEREEGDYVFTEWRNAITWVRTHKK